VNSIHTLENHRLRVEFEERAGGPFVRLTDVTSGTVWGPTPAVALEVFDVPCQRVETPAPSAVALHKIENGVELHVAHEWYGIRLIVRFSIDKAGELIATIPTESITQARRPVAMLAGVGVLPALLEVDRQHPGHLVLPLQNGALLYPERHQRIRDSFLIYGQQNRWEDLPLLPCCGAVREQSKAGMLAIAASGECDAECKVDLDGHGRGSTGFSMRYLYGSNDPVDPIDRIVRFVPLHGADANYAGMGRRMFRHVGEISGRPTLKQRAAKNPQLEYAASAYTIKFFHAHKQIGALDGSGEYNVWTTFDEASQQLSLMKQHGIDRVWVQGVGWNPEGHDGVWPTRFPIEPTLGGEAGFRRHIAHGQSLGYQMCVHDNYTDRYKRSSRFNPDHCIGAMHGGPLVRGCWSGGMNHLSWGLALPDSEVRDEMRKVKDLGISGVYYIDAMGNPLEISYNLKHGERRYRRACADGIVRILKEAEMIFGGSATEAGFLYCAAHTDSIAATWYPHVLAAAPKLIDRHVPLWCMAVKGHIFYESDVLHNYALDVPHAAPHQTMSTRLLEMAEVGMKPRTELAYRRPSWLSYPVEPCIDAMKIDYDLMLRRLKSTCLEPITDHELMSGDMREGNHVMRTAYGDGTEVVCDYGRQRLEINGEPYPLPVKFKKQKLIPIGERPESSGDAGVGDPAVVGTPN
jgi:hypothetical protein